MKNHSPKAIAVLLFFYLQMQTLYSYSKPMNCTDTSRLCTSFIAFKPSPNETLPILQSMFDVLPGDITAENGDLNYVFIKKNCACLYPYRMYLTNTTYTMRASGGYVHEMVRGAYQGLAFLPNSTRIARARAVISLKLFCGCSSGLWNYLMSYVMGEEDTVESLASRFGVSMDSIESINGIQDPNIITVGQNYYIPLNSVPGSPYPVETDISPAPVPALVSNNYSDQVDHKRNVPYGWIVGSLGFGFGLIVIAALICVMLRCFGEAQGNKKDPDGKNTHKFYVLHNTSFCCKPGDEKHTNGESSDRHINYPKAFGAAVFNMDKPAVLTYEDLLFATDNFSETNLLGHGRYGSVYYGLLYDQEVAIKRMTATKSEAFMSEMKVLCKVHHANLVELIGYAASGDELFLIYENAQKGSLRSHLHDPQSKGYPPLSWIMRVQIALDAARGLEYIHEHAKINYIHRDIKTNNILLDGAFRAKISDFGLAKLVGKASDGEVKATGVVGTFGYLAPEYLSDGLATTKSDVYAFGVVLFEIISGREAAIQTRDMVTKSYERRSLASIMLRALRNSPDSMNMSRLKDYIDPNLLDLYPHDCLYKLAMLAKQCVDDDPILRPDMKQVVISLSQILLSSVEWEAALAGNSEIFSGIVQGR